MRKLITANFHRFSKDRFSWCVLGIVVILSLGNVFNSVGSFETMAASGYAVSLDEYYFNQAPLIGAFLALLISMFFWGLSFPKEPFATNYVSDISEMRYSYLILFPVHLRQSF